VTTKDTKQPSTQVTETAQRRRFSAKYKLKILAKAAGCKESGSLGALLRKEGLYSSHLVTWRRAQTAGALAGLAPKKRGRKAAELDARDERIATLEREVRELELRAKRAEGLVELQKKLSSLFDHATPTGGRS
jgi:transposase-like protein